MCTIDIVTCDNVTMPHAQCHMHMHVGHGTKESSASEGTSTQGAHTRSSVVCPAMSLTPYVV